jgi:hypothetical protein
MGNDLLLLMRERLLLINESLRDKKSHRCLGTRPGIQRYRVPSAPGEAQGVVTQAMRCPSSKTAKHSKHPYLFVLGQAPSAPTKNVSAFYTNSIRTVKKISLYMVLLKVHHHNI